MNANLKERTKRGTHARIAAEEVRSNSKIGLFVLVIVFVILVAILLRLADFAGRGPRRAPALPPAAWLLHMP